MFRNEMREHLEQKIIPFWQNLKDDASGGLRIRKTAACTGP